MYSYATLRTTTIKKYCSFDIWNIGFPFENCENNPFKDKIQLNNTMIGDLITTPSLPWCTIFVAKQVRVQVTGSGQFWNGIGKQREDYKSLTEEYEHFHLFISLVFFMFIHLLQCSITV